MLFLLFLTFGGKKMKFLDGKINKFKTIMMVLALTMFSVQLASAQVITGTVSGCSDCHHLLDTAAGVTITLSGATSASTPTTSDGAYTFTEVSLGSNTVTPSLATQAEHDARGFAWSPPVRTINITDTATIVSDFAARCANDTIACPTSNACGVIENNGCFQELDCGSCTGTDICNDETNQCEADCEPETECSIGAECGTEPDGCGGDPIVCGICDIVGETCVDNMCVELPDIDCACDDDWKNHGAYVKCVAQAAGDLVDAGLITEEEKDALMGEMASSDCGK